jgi:hypothetical protein
MHQPLPSIADLAPFHPSRATGSARLLMAAEYAVAIQAFTVSVGFHIDRCSKESTSYLPWRPPKLARRALIEHVGRGITDRHETSLLNDR